MKLLSAEEYNGRLCEEAERAFLEHDQAVAYHEGHWGVRSSRHSSYWAEVVVFKAGAVGVWGDIAAVTFAYVPMDLLRTAEGALTWMATSEVDYAVSKAKIGCGGLVDARDYGVAAYQLEQHRSGGVADHDMLRIAIGLVRECAAWEFIDEACHTLEIERVGVVFPLKVVYARAAIQKLCSLLVKMRNGSTSLALKFWSGSAEL
jgi:hypothetical protein